MKKKDDELVELKKEDSSLKLELSRVKHKGEILTCTALLALDLVSDLEHGNLVYDT